MRLLFACSMLAAAIAGGTTLAAPRHEQQTTERPGELTKGRMFIENRGRHEAIPVTIQDVASTSPVRVSISRQMWEYRTVALSAQDDAARVLTVHGLEGWEATGFQPTLDGRRIVLLKRPVTTEAHKAP